MNRLKLICFLFFVLLILIPGMTGCIHLNGLSGIGNTRIQKDQDVLSPSVHLLESKEVASEERLRTMLLQYISNPQFSNPDLIYQITGTKAEIELLCPAENMIYFSVSEKYYTRDMLKQLTTAPEFVEFGRTARNKLTGRKIILGNFEFRKPGNFFLRFPSKDFRVDRVGDIVIPYATVQYRVTMQELKGFYYGNSLYGGSLRALTKIDNQGRSLYITNYGALVAKKGEKSLQRLTQSLTAGINSKEKQAQLLLDFVTKEIEYDYEEAVSGKNVIKRPNEVLMTKRSTCSGKVVLYASLLEQMDIDYNLLYYDGHIAVGVEGDHVNRNGLSLRIRHKMYSVAETTAPGFQIGLTRLKGNPGILNVIYIQRPAEDSQIYDVKTGDALPLG